MWTSYQPLELTPLAANLWLVQSFKLIQCNYFSKHNSGKIIFNSMSIRQ
ncbi:hypothetical protein KsCSTR_20180 [Candidatus Kuenenia stuttgartiensis]|uniref:Uncharacterized protein n=1 Tax=Kuenenia stuttgartiensis TaxID=174633 RepID=Q1Q2R4_KUEST|nr:hypothetical protein KsCSTR_20180 [Candidatus Kuenenia stuttgartiensis]CAJ74296.1 unknown protein [Candidatus Kuenenia stuttgartiensis]